MENQVFLAISMSNTYSDRVRGELLSEWRTTHQWEISALAIAANLSVAQVRQLESGGSSLFYTPAIKEVAARKVARLLGEDADAVIRVNDWAADAHGPTVVEDLVALSSAKPHARSSWSMLWLNPLFLLAPVVLLLAVFASGWLQQKWLDGGEEQFWRKNALADASTGLLSPLLLDSSSKASDPPPVTEPATPLLAAQPDMTNGTQSAGLLSVGPSSVQAGVASLPSMPAIPPTPSLPSLPDTGTADKHKVCKTQAPDTVLTPSSPSKAGDMVYIVAYKAGVVCVEDAAGLRTLLSLKINESRSVYGAPPWRVHFELPQQAQLYFQGVRLHLPHPELMTVALREGPRKSK